jgi:heat shock protein HslJ
MSRSTPLPVALGALLLIGTMSAVTVASDDPGARELVDPPMTPTIEGIDWRLVKAQLSGAYADIPQEVVATLRMENGQAGGSGGCNQWTAEYELDGQRLVFGPVASTLMLCEGPGGDVETFFLADLSAVQTWSLEGETLVLSGDTGPILAFEAGQALSLDGQWVVTQYNDGQGHLIGVDDGSVTIGIAEGRVSGTAGCNRFSGALTQEGDRITIGPLMSTKMACQPAEVMARESAVMAALEASTGALPTADGGLELVDAAGTLQLGLTPLAEPAGSPAPSPAA